MAAVTWSVKVVPRQTSQAPPVLLALPNPLVNQLLMVYLGASDLKIRHAVFAGDKWDIRGIVKDQAGHNEQSSQAPPAVAALGGQLHMVYLSEHDQKIRHAIGTIT